MERRWLSNRLGAGVVCAVAVLGLLAAGCGPSGEREISMYFVPSGNRTAMIERTGELSLLLEKESGLTLRTEVPASYLEVIDALGTKEADVAWVPPFSYVIANSRYGALARLQVVRSYTLSAVVITRSDDDEPATIEDLSGMPIAIPASVEGELRRWVVRWLDDLAPGWRAVPAESDREAVRLLIEQPERVAAAVSSWVFSGPSDFIGDGRKELEGERPGTMEETRVIAQLPRAVIRQLRGYTGCILARTDSGIRRLEDLNGRSFGFTNKSSTSGYIFARALLARHGVELAEERFLGGHPDVVQEVWTRGVDAGAVYYNPAGERQQQSGSMVGDARSRLLRRFHDDQDRLRALEEVRVIALTDAIPSDVFCVRSGFPAELWQRLATALRGILETSAGQRVFFELTGGVAVVPATDAGFEGFRRTLTETGISADQLLEAQEEELER